MARKRALKCQAILDMLSMIKDRPLFAEPYIPARIDSVAANTPAMKGGIKAGDLLKSINGKPIETWADFNYQIGVLHDVAAVKNTHKDSLALRNVVLTVQRSGTSKIDTLKMQLDADLKMGVIQSSLLSYYKPTQEKFSFLESFPAGVNYGINILRGYVGNFKYLASADGAKSLGGFGSIGKLFPPYWDWYYVLEYDSLF